MLVLILFEESKYVPAVNGVPPVTDASRAVLRESVHGDPKGPSLVKDTQNAGHDSLRPTQSAADPIFTRKTYRQRLA